jgi:hypothetical protein
MTTTEAIQRAYDITDRMQVSGGAIEQMAALRAALREAYAAARKAQDEQSHEEDDGK